MKLKTTDWKAAWFDNHISNQFFQEMAKLEKSTLRNLDSTAQWMEQITIEVGQLAQAMIRLENDAAPESQVRHACEKAMRLSALGLHLMTTLDEADRNVINSTTANFSGSHKPPSAKEIQGQNGPLTQPAPAIQRGQAPGDAQKEQPHPQGQPQARPPMQTPMPWRAVPQPLPAQPVKSGARQKREANLTDTWTEAEAKQSRSIPIVASLIDSTGQQIGKQEHRVRDTIKSLSKQGLSRAEIELVTGEPRHIVEAVLNRGKAV